LPRAYRVLAAQCSAASRGRCARIRRLLPSGGIVQRRRRIGVAPGGRAGGIGVAHSRTHARTHADTHARARAGARTHADTQTRTHSRTQTRTGAVRSAGGSGDAAARVVVARSSCDLRSSEAGLGWRLGVSGTVAR
jgi:hypothetical protein